MDNAVHEYDIYNKPKNRTIPRWFIAAFIFLLVLNVFQFFFSMRHQFYHLYSRLQADVLEPMELRRGLANQDVVVQSDREGTNDIFFVHFTDGDYQMTNLTADLDGDALHPVWSPDGQWVAFTLRTTGSIPSLGDISPNDRIYIMREDGSQKTDVTQGTSPTWSPDSKTLYFTRLWEQELPSPVHGDIYSHEIDGGEETLVMDVATCNCTLYLGGVNVFSNWQVYGNGAMFQLQTDSWFPSVFQWDSVSGTGQRVAGDYYQAASDPAWSPSGIAVVGQYFSGGWVGRTQNGTITVSGGSPTWSPDDQYILFDGLLPGDNYGLVMLRSGVDSIEPRIVLQEKGVNISHPSWKPGTINN